jgi:hypothetical protein
MFRQLGLSSLLAASLVVSACKSKSQDPSPAPAPAASTVTPGSKPAEPPPVTDDTLSFAQPEGDKCNWGRLEASRGTGRNIFTFEGGCELAQFAWSPEGSKGAVLQSFEDQRTPRAWTVDLVTGQGTALPLPEVGRTTELGFDPEGRPVALVAHYASPHMKAPERVEKDGQSAFVFEGKQYPIDREGEIGLAHAYRREGDTWKRVETRVTDYGADSAEETRVLDLAKKLGPNTKLASKEGLRPESVSPEEQTALDASAEAELIGPRGEDLLEGSNWVRSLLPGGPIYYRAEPVEVPNASPPMRWNVGGKLVEPEKLTLPTDASLSLESRGNVLLVIADKAVRLYDVKQKKHLLSLDGVFHPSFWPRNDTRAGKSGALSMKLDDPQVAFDVLGKSSMALGEAHESCAQLAEAGTLGALVKKARADYKEWSVQCEAQENTKTWACKAQFMTPGDEENPDGPSMRLQYRVDDATRTVQPGSLICQMAG